jgi:hypothetical protein
VQKWLAAPYFKKLKNKKMITLHFSKINSDEIKQSTFTKKSELISALSLKDHVVYLVYMERLKDGNDGEVFVSDNDDSIYLVLDGFLREIEPDCDISVHEYESYEEAYKVALDIKEVNELCYSK